MADRNDVERAAAAALAGRLVVIPTDTVYGIGARPDRPDATAALFEAKRRPPELELPVLVASLEAASEVGDLGLRGGRLAEAFWPGPLTIVVERTDVSRSWALGENARTVGLRIPDHRVAIAILERTGPLAVTSANISGRVPPSSCDELVALFGEAVAIYVCDDAPLRGRPSTVVDVTGREARLLRHGALSEDAVREALVGST